jgi:hypothetical protein
MSYQKAFVIALGIMLLVSIGMPAKWFRKWIRLE